MTISKAAYYSASRQIIDAFAALTDTERLTVLGAAVFYISKRNPRLVKSNTALIEAMALNACANSKKKKTVLEN